MKAIFEINQKYHSQISNKEFIQTINHVREVVDFYSDFLAKFKESPRKIDLIKSEYEKFPITKNLFQLSNQELFIKLRHNFDVLVK